MLEKKVFQIPNIWGSGFGLDLVVETEKKGDTVVVTTTVSPSLPAHPMLGV